MPKGRTKVLNTEDTKELIIRLLKNSSDIFYEKFKALAETKPESFVKLYMQLMEYVTPKLSRQEITSDTTPVVNIAFIQKQLEKTFQEIEPLQLEESKHKRG